MTIKDLRTAILGRVGVVMGASYSAAPYQIDLRKNSSKNQQNKYTVVPLGMVDSATVTRSITYDQEFQIQGSTNYINKQGDDSLQLDASIDIMELIRKVYADLIDTKCGLPGVCLNVTDLDIEEPEFNEDDKVIIITMTCVVKYRELI